MTCCRTTFSAFRPWIPGGRWRLIRYPSFRLAIPLLSAEVPRGGSTTYHVSLSDQPLEIVFVDIAVSGSGVAVEPSTLELWPQYWSQPKEIRVTVDSGAPLSEVTLTHRSRSLAPQWDGLEKIVRILPTTTT